MEDGIFETGRQIANLRESVMVATMNIDRFSRAWDQYCNAMMDFYAERKRRQIARVMKQFRERM